MKKLTLRAAALLLSLGIALSLIPAFTFPVHAAGALAVEMSPSSDPNVYAPGVYDLVVYAKNAENPTYQWYASVGRNVPVDELIRLEENNAFQGTTTNHLRCKVKDGDEYGKGWESIYFCCKVTTSDGKTAWGPDMNMVVFTHASLLEKLKQEDVGFTKAGVTVSGGRSQFDREEDGIRYYTATGDFSVSGLMPSHSFTPVPADIRVSSETETRIETTITYDGRTIPYDNPVSGFLPTKYGANAVTFRSDLVLYVDNARMETLDSVTTVVSVWPSESIGVALTKSNDTPVIEGPYSGSRVTARIAKNERVRLLKDAGGYYRVAVNGYFGYIDKAALSVMQNISSVSLSVQEPAAGSSVPSSVTTDDPELYSAENRWNQEMWYDKTADKYLQSGDRFIAGHKYRLVVWLSAASGKRFALSGNAPQVVAKVNGLDARAAKAYEQDPEEIIEISYDFDHVHSLTKVNRVYPTCTAAGREYHYRCSCGWSFEDNNAAVRITDDNWGVIPALGHWESGWMSNGTAHYRVCQRRNCGETIEGTRGTHSGGTATCVSGAICTVCQLEYGAKGNHSWGNEWNYTDAAGHAHLCTNLCGAHSAVTAHRPGKDATAADPQVCLDCGYVMKEATGQEPATEKNDQSTETDPSDDPASESGNEPSSPGESSDETVMPGSENSGGSENPGESEGPGGSDAPAEPGEPGPGGSKDDNSNGPTGSGDGNSNGPAVFMGIPFWVFLIIAAALVLIAGAVALILVLSKKKG